MQPQFQVIQQKGAKSFNMIGMLLILTLKGMILVTTCEMVLWYARIINENASLPKYTSDIKDDVFTCRLQFRF